MKEGVRQGHQKAKEERKIVQSWGVATLSMATREAKRGGRSHFRGRGTLPSASSHSLVGLRRNEKGHGCVWMPVTSLVPPPGFQLVSRR